MELLEDPRQILAWYLDAGVDEAVGETPIDRFALAGEALAKRAEQAETMLKSAQVERDAQPAKTSARDRTAASFEGPAPVKPRDTGVSEEQVKNAVALAGAAKSVDDLRSALEGFEGCPLKKNAMNLVFGDGNPAAKVVLIGDAPGADEDRKGVPFVGPAGELFDKMLASIGLDRSSVFLANTVFWRPPGNRTPLAGEIAVCLPFVERLIELIDPAMLITVGGAATHELLAQQGNVSRLVGKWYTFETPRMSHPISATAIYHPEFLIKSPAMKRQAWQNLLMVRAKLDELGV